MSAAVCVKDLEVRRGSTVAVRDLSFSIEPGEVLCLLGPNGAGKSSTVETIEGYLSPSSGSVEVLGHDPIAEKRDIVGAIGVMLQRGGIYPSLNPSQALHLFASYYPTPLEPEALLERLGLRDVTKTPWRRLSGGEQQRTSLALALIGQPRVLFLDEPTAGVDIHGRLAIREVIAEQAAKGVAILLTTHELSEAEIVADRIAIMTKGTLAALGPKDELITPGVRFLSVPGLPISELATLLGVEVLEEAAGRYRVASDSSSSLVASLNAWLSEHGAPLSELRAGGSLETIYLSIVGDRAFEPEAQPSLRRRRR